LAISIAANVSAERADLIDLDQYRVRDALLDCALEIARIRYRESSPTSCTFLPSRSVSSFHPSQSFLRHAVFDSEDGILVHPAGKVIDELGCLHAAAFERSV
jgi:hypothetical protein